MMEALEEERAGAQLEDVVIAIEVSWPLEEDPDRRVSEIRVDSTSSDRVAIVVGILTLALERWTTPIEDESEPPELEED